MCVIVKLLFLNLFKKAFKKHLHLLCESSKRRSISAPIAQLVEQLTCNQ